MRGRIVGLGLFALSLLAAPSAFAAADPVVQFQSIAPQQQGSTLQSQLIVKFWSSRSSADSAPSGTIDWGDGSTADSVMANANPSCTNTPDGSTLGTCPAHQGFEYDVTGGPHTFQRNGPYTLAVAITGFQNADAGMPFPLDGQTTIPSASCSTTTATLGFAQLKLLGAGCITTSGTQQITPAGVPVLVNGLELHPDPGVTLTLDSSTGMLTSSGNATLDLGEAALHQHQTSFKPNTITWRVVPNPGETSIGEPSAGRFQVSIGGTLLNLPPLSVNDITLGNGSSEMSFTVGVPIPALTSFFGTIRATATILSTNSTGGHFDGLDATIATTQKPELNGVKVAAPFKAFYGHLKFTLSTNTWDVQLIFSVPGAGGISAHTTIVSGKPTLVSLDASYNTPGLAIGDTGGFLQEVSGEFIHYPHYSRPIIGLTQHTGDTTTDNARAAQCADINTHYDQYIALNKPFPSYCGQVGTISFDPPMEVDGAAKISAGPVIGKNSALIINGNFRYVDSYFDGSNNVPWAFAVHGSVSMVGLPFNRSTLQVYQTGNFQNQTKFAPIDNSGTEAWAEVHGDGLVEAGGGFDYRFPQSSDNWLMKIDGEAAIALIPKGAAIGAPAPGSTPEQYANVVQAHADHWTVAGTITGQICAQIPHVASGCATGAAGISNNGVAGCASFSLPGTKTLQTIAVGFAKGINALARGGKAAGNKLAGLFKSLGHTASHAASQTKHFFQSVGSGIKKVGNKIGNGFKSAGSKLRHFFHFAPDRRSATSTSNEVINENIVIPDVNYSIGAVYRWSDKSTHVITSCSHDALLNALASRDRAHGASAGVPAAQVIVRGATTAPRLFVITGVAAAPDVLVMGPDGRAIRTFGPGFIEPGWIVYKDAAARTTYVDAVAAPAGAWDFIAAPGTSLIRSIQTAAGESIPSVTAGLTGIKGRAYTITYRVAGRAAGQTIRLGETDGSGTTITVGVLRGSHGSIRYLPSSKLPGQTRILIAIVTRGSTQLSAQPLTAIDLTQVARKRKR